MQWAREESLSTISVAEFVELPEKEVILSHIGQERETALARLKRQLADAQVILPRPHPRVQITRLKFVSEFPQLCCQLCKAICYRIVRIGLVCTESRCGTSLSGYIWLQAGYRSRHAIWKSLRYRLEQRRYHLVPRFRAWVGSPSRWPRDTCQALRYSNG